MLHFFERKAEIRKGRIVRVAAGALSMVLLCSFVGCSKVPELKYDKNAGGYVDKKNDEVYLLAPDAYEVSGYDMENLVGRNDGFDFFRVTGCENNDYIYNPDLGFLMYASDCALPTIADMKVSKIHITAETGSTIESIATEEQADKIAALLDAYRNGEEIAYLGNNPVYSFRVKLEPEGLPFLRYSLIFVQFKEDYVETYQDENGETVVKNYGKSFLYSRTDKRYVAIGDLMQEYVDAYNASGS